MFLPQGGGTAHMVRYAGNAAATGVGFWLDMPPGHAPAVTLFVKHLQQTPALAAMAARLPAWTSPAAVTTYQSAWELQAPAAQG